MDRRRAAGLLLALAACIATATAAPTASNHTALDRYDGAPDGCYYNFQHYGEGDRIMTNEPCLNCTCHNRMLMCYLRVCPFTKPIGQDCTIEKRADQCCPIVTCPDVPVDLLTSTTTSPAEYGSTGMGKLDKYGCSINGKYFSEGSKVPPTPNKPCEHCYCIRNMTTCVMQECTLHVDGCTPIYHKDVCCPVRYSCDHPEDEMPLLDDLSTTVRPTPGFLLTTTTVSPVTQMSQDCVYDNRIFPDGALIKTEKACDHCYCMKGDIVCVVQECGTPMENEGKNCTALPPREGVCCPDTYICEGDEPTTGTYEIPEISTHEAYDVSTTLSPPRRTSSEGSGYRNEPDEIPYSEPDIEGSGEEEELKQPVEITSSSTPGLTDEILTSTEETHEFIPLTTTKPEDVLKVTTVRVDEDDKTVTSVDENKQTFDHQEFLTSTTNVYSKKDNNEPVTDKTYLVTDFGSGEMPEDEKHKPTFEDSQTPSLFVTEENVTTEPNEENIVPSKATDAVIYEIQTSTSISVDEEIYTTEPSVQDAISGDNEEKTTYKSPTEQDISNTLKETTQTIELTEQSKAPVEITTKSPESSSSVTTSIPVIENENNQVDVISPEYNLKPEGYPSSTMVTNIDDEFVTTEIPDNELSTDIEKITEKTEPQQHITASTPMLEEIEKDTTEYNELEHLIPSDDTFTILSTTTSNIQSVELDKEEANKENDDVIEKDIPRTTNVPALDQQAFITTESSYQEKPSDIGIKEITEPEPLATSTNTPAIDESGRRTVPPDHEIKDHSTLSDFSLSSTLPDSEQATTEPDKGLNTIPSDLLDKEITEPTEITEKPLIDENITTESDLETTHSMDYDSKTSPAIETTISSDTSVSREDSNKLTTELGFRKEDHSPTESQDSFESTTMADSVTKDVIFTLAHDGLTGHEKTTEPTSDVDEISTTLQPKYTEGIELITPGHESADGTLYESSTPKVSPEQDYAPAKQTTTIESSYDATSETTIANQEDNEIISEPRIPGEGDCLLNGVRYLNESNVPSTNKCQSGCKCISSIIKCDPILCSPPPEYMNNCETTYDSPDACCPTYICDHKTETMPPQSHSQMSGTETPVISPVSCQGDECELNIDKKHHEEPSVDCKSGSCASQPDVSQEISGYPPSEVPKKPILGQEEYCSGDNCTPILCTEENGCQAQVKPCEGEKCEVPSDSIASYEPQPCVDGKDCTLPIIPTKQCSSGNCDATDIQSEGQNVPSSSEQECKEESCKKIDTSPLEPSITHDCSEPDCKQLQENVVVSTIPLKETETTEKLESQTESSYTKQPDINKIVTTQTETTADKYITTLTDENKQSTKSDFESVPTTESINLDSTEKTITTTHVSEEKLPEISENQDTIPVSTETDKADKEILVESHETATDISHISTVPEDTVNIDGHVMKTDYPQDFGTTESAEIYDGHTDESAYTTEKQKTTDYSGKPEIVDATKVISEESSTMQPITEKEPIDESSTKRIEYQEMTKLPEIIEQGETSTKYLQESSSMGPLTTESQDVSGSSDIIIDEETITKKTTDVTVMDITKSSDDFTKEIITEPSATINIAEQSQETDNTKTVQEKTTEIPAVSDITEGINLESSTEKIEEEVKADVTKSTSTESEESTKSPEDKKHETVSSILTEDTTTELPKTSATESHETSKHSEEHEVTTTKIMEASSLEPQDVTVELHEKVTNLDQDDTTKVITDESSITSSENYYTDSQMVTVSPEYIEHKDNTMTVAQETSSESLENIITDQYDTTSKISEELSTEPAMTHPIEEKDKSESSEKEDNEKLTTKIYEEQFTEQPTTFITKSHDEIDQEKTTSKISDEFATASPQLHLTEKQEETKSPEEISNELTTITILKDTTTIPTREITTDKILVTLGVGTESPTAQVTEKLSNVEETESLSTTLEPSDKRITEPSETSDGNTVVPTDYESQEQHIPDSDKVTDIHPSTTGEIATETTTTREKPTLDLESAKITTVKDQEITTSEFTTVPSVSELETSLPTVSGADELPVVSPSDSVSKPESVDESAATEQAITTSVITKQDVTTIVPDLSDNEQNLNDNELEKQPTVKPDFETQTVLSPVTSESETDLQETRRTEKPDVFTISDKEPAYEDTDELRTTTSDALDFTTLKPSKESYDSEKSTEISSTLQIEQSTENLLITSHEIPTTEIKTEDIKPVVEEEIKPEKPSAVTDSPKETESMDTTQTSQPSISTILDENFTDSTTKSHLDEEIQTVEPYHEAKEPEKSVEVQSLVTEKYEISTKASESENEYTTQGDVTQPIKVDKVTIPPNELLITTTNKSEDKVESTTLKNILKPVDRDESTESQTTLEKEYLPEEGQIDKETSKPEQSEFPDHKFTTEHSKTTVTVGSTEAAATEAAVTEAAATEAAATEAAATDAAATDAAVTEAAATDAAATEKQEPSFTDQSLVDENTDTTVVYDHTLLPNLHITKPSEETQGITEPSEVISPELSGTEQPSVVPHIKDHDLTSTDVPEFDKEQPELGIEMSTSFGPTTAPKHEYPTKQFTTENPDVTESVSSVYTEKEPEITQTMTTQQDISSEDHLTTRKQLEDVYEDVHQTTASTIQDILEKSTHRPVLYEEEPTTLFDIVTPSTHENMPSTADAEKISVSHETIAVQTEKVPSTSQEITVPEEELFITTPKVTTIKAEEAISTLSSAYDKTPQPTDKFEESPLTTMFSEVTTPAFETPKVTAPETTLAVAIEEAIATTSEEPIVSAHGEPMTNMPSEKITPPAESTESPIATIPEAPTTHRHEEEMTSTFETPIESGHDPLMTKVPEEPITPGSETPALTLPEKPITNAPEELITDAPEITVMTATPERIATTVPETTTVHKAPASAETEVPVLMESEAPTTKPSEPPVTVAQDTTIAPELSTEKPKVPTTKEPELPVTSAPEIPKPVSTEQQPTDSVPTPEEEGSFPPSGGYGQEPDYPEEDQTFGPGTCRYGGKVYVSAQQIPRDDPCDFCFCFRSDIICLQQSCPPPIHGCHEEPIQGFCCPRYECPVSMATTVNVTTTTTTTTTTLPPNFPIHSYKGSVLKQGCQIKGQTYKVGEVVRASSGPCLHCTCGGDGQMKCDPKVCTPEPMLRQMIAAAVSAKRRR